MRVILLEGNGGWEILRMLELVQMGEKNRAVERLLTCDECSDRGKHFAMVIQLLVLNENYFP